MLESSLEPRGRSRQSHSSIGPSRKSATKNQEKHPLCANILDSRISKLIEKHLKLSDYNGKGYSGKHV